MSEGLPVPRSSGPGAVRAARPGAGMLTSAAVAILFVLLFGLWIRAQGGAPTEVDRWWHGAVGLEPGSPAFVLASALAWIGSSLGVTACVVIASAALLTRRRFRAAAALCTAAVIGVILSEALKAFVARPRPIDALLHPPGYSYPSGHSMGAAAFAVSLSLIVILAGRASRTTRHWAVVGATAWVLVMMWSRAAVRVHWLTDTIAGALLGTAAALIAGALWLRAGRDPEPAVERVDERSPGD